MAKLPFDGIESLEKESQEAFELLWPGNCHIYRIYDGQENDTARLASAASVLVSMAADLVDMVKDPKACVQLEAALVDNLSSRLK